MRIVKLKAGLGNQMFQYAFMLLLRDKYKLDDVRIDVSYYDNEKFKKYLDSGINLLNVHYSVASREDLKKSHIPYNNYPPHSFKHRAIAGIQTLFNKRYYFERNRDYVDVNSILRYAYFDGYWQSWRYLEPVRDILKKEFRPKTDLSSKTLRFIQKIGSFESVFIGVRKGDYTETSKATEHYGVPSIDYYCSAIQRIKMSLINPYFVVFSDDINWVKQNIDFNQMGVETSMIEFRNESDVYSDFEELFVMASCKNAIISNSTFNFWGAWLIDNPDKLVIAPKEWFKDGSPIDIIPPTWVQL